MSSEDRLTCADCNKPVRVVHSPNRGIHGHPARLAPDDTTGEGTVECYERLPDLTDLHTGKPIPRWRPVARTEAAPALDGRAVHAAWRDGMLAQGREVAPERMAWETLTQQDRDLDDGIAARLTEAAPALDVERLAEAYLRLLRARHDTAHVGDIISGPFDSCGICQGAIAALGLSAIDTPRGEG